MTLFHKGDLVVIKRVNTAVRTPGQVYNTGRGRYISRYVGQIAEVIMPRGPMGDPMINSWYWIVFDGLGLWAHKYELELIFSV
jgi:hypothetical protein